MNDSRADSINAACHGDGQLGQRVNPYGFRPGFDKTPQGRWFAEKTSAETLRRDVELRADLGRRFAKAGLSEVDLARSGNRITITLSVASPAAIPAEDLEAAKAEVREITSGEVSILVREVEYPALDAQLVAQYLARQLQRGVTARRAMKQAMENAFRFGAHGIKIRVSGNLDGAHAQRTEWYQDGRLPLHTLKADIDYGFAEARLAHGVIRVKAWIFKGLRSIQQRLHDRVVLALHSAGLLFGNDVHVDTSSGVVRLSGVVANAGVRTQIETVAAGVRNVSSVVNELAVAPPPAMVVRVDDQFNRELVSLRLRLIALLQTVVRRREHIEREMQQLIASMTPPLAVPLPSEVLQARRNADARTRMLAEFGAYTSTQIGDRAGSKATNRAALAHRWKADGRIFFVTHQGSTWFPGYQFAADGQPRPVVADLLKVLGATLTGWELALWFTTSNGWLDGARPVDLLTDAPERVREAARREAEERVF